MTESPEVGSLMSRPTTRTVVAELTSLTPLKPSRNDVPEAV